jgi:hypothetical protein
LRIRKKAAPAAFFIALRRFRFRPQRNYNSRMRAFLPVIFLLSLLVNGARAQGVSDAFEIAQRFAEAGAWQAALARVDQMQPPAVSGPRWGDWEQLRCTLMYRLNRHQELAKRIAALPAAAPKNVARFCLMQGARGDRRGAGPVGA